MEKLMTLGIVISALDKVSGPISKMGANFTKLKQTIQNVDAAASTSKIAELEKKIESLSSKEIKIKSKIEINDKAITSVKNALKDVEEELKELSNRKVKIEKDFKNGKISADEFEGSLKDIDNRIDRLNRKKLSLNKELQKGEERSGKLKSELQRVQNLTQKLSRQKLGLKDKLKDAELAAKLLNHSLRETASKVALISTKFYAFGRVVTSAFAPMIGSYKEIQKAQGDIASLGIDEKGIEKITKAAKEMSNQFAGITAPEFIKTSYDIKSGISSLSDEGVAEFTKFAAMTASATKSTTEEMTKLFALGYGIFKNTNETDIDFGKRFSASIGKAVQAFRTDGSDLVQGLSNIGATAKAMGVSLSEELAIVGVAKGAFSSAAEAGTGYRAFLAGAINAQEKLGLTFTDSEGKLLPMVEILEQIKQKYGELDAVEMAELKKAFGSEEALKIITGLIDKTDELKKAQKDLANASIADVEAMAKARNRGKEFEILQQRISNLAATFGKFLAPVVDFTSKKIGKFAEWLDKIANSNSFVKYIFYIVAGLGAFALILGTIGIALSALMTGLSFFNGLLGTKVMLLGIAKTASFAYAASLKGISIAMSMLGRSFWPIMILAGLAMLVMKYWEPIKEFFGNLWDGIKSIFITAWESLKKIFSFSPLGIVINAWQPVFDWLSSNFEWFGKAVDGIKSIGSKIASFFSFGDEEKKTNIGKTTTVQPVETSEDFYIKTKNRLMERERKRDIQRATHNYSININVNGTNAKPEEIARAVQKAIQKTQDRKFEDDE